MPQPQMIVGHNVGVSDGREGQHQTARQSSPVVARSLLFRRATASRVLELLK